MIKIVMGIPCSGKSYFIEKNFPNIKKIDLYDYQKELSYDKIWDSYVAVKDEIIKCIKNKEDFIVEHTLLRAERRKYYIDEIRKVTDEDIALYFVSCDDKTYKEHCNKRGIPYICLDENPNMEILEKPMLSEGFKEIHFIENTFSNEK